MANRWGHQAGADPYNQFATPRDDKLGKVRDPLLTASRWFKRRSQKEKVLLGSICGLLVSACLLVTARHQVRLRQYVSDLQALFLMWLVIEDHDNLFIMAELVHFAGIGMLLYKLFSKKNAGGMESYHSCSNCNLPNAAWSHTDFRDPGLSLRSQELSALFLGIRLFCR